MPKGTQKSISIESHTRPIPLARPKFGRNHAYNPSKPEMKKFYDWALKFAPKKPLEGEIVMYAWFTFTHPKIHFRTGKFSDILKPSAPYWHSKRPDLSNLIKFYEDALGYDGSKIFFLDDSQIASIHAYKNYGDEYKVRIQFSEII